MTRRPLNRKALTLMELLVVLLILVALAAILVPMLPSMIGRAHTSSSAANIAEINKFVQTYEAIYQSHASDFDALVDNTGVLASYLPGGNAGGAIVTGALTAGQRDALANAGIVRLQTMFAAPQSDPWNPTFNPYDGNVIDLTTGAPTIAFATEAAVEQAGAGLVNDPTSTVPWTANGDVYVIVGLGKRSTMIGRVIAEAPTHFGENDAASASRVYARYGLVFRVTRGGATPLDLERAVFVGAVAIHDDGLVGADGHLEEWYNLNRGQ